MEKYLGLLLIILLSSCSVEDESKELTSIEVLNKSIEYHDPNENWDKLEMSIHIQEPRTGNPLRYSVIKLNNNDDSFELIRNRDDHLSKHVIDKSGNLKVYLDDREEIAENLKEKYRLQPERNKMYRSFYKMMYGLPMSLNKNAVNEYGEIESTIYNSQNCYKIPIKLHEEMFSKNWIIYISKSIFEFKGMEIIFPEDNTKGERLYFDGSIRIKDVIIPRIRHWYELQNNEYSGSDVIVDEL